jgi:hypothetical protein
MKERKETPWEEMNGLRAYPAAQYPPDKLSRFLLAYGLDHKGEITPKPFSLTLFSRDFIN